MGARNTFKLLLLIIAAGSIWLTGCKKTSPAVEAPSIVGSWGGDSITEVLIANNVVLRDTALFGLGTDQLAITFNANGYYTQFTNRGISGSAYTLYGNLLSLYDTAGGTNSWIRYTVPVLTENRLQMIMADTSATGDTIAQIIFTFTR